MHDCGLGKNRGNDPSTIFIVTFGFVCSCSILVLHTFTHNIAHPLTHPLSLYVLSNCQVLFWTMTWIYRHISLSPNNHVRDKNEKKWFWFCVVSAFTFSYINQKWPQTLLITEGISWSRRFDRKNLIDIPFYFHGHAMLYAEENHKQSSSINKCLAINKLT